MECIVLTFSSRDNNNDADLIAIARAADNFGYESFWTGASGTGRLIWSSRRLSRIPVPAGMTANTKPPETKRYPFENAP